MNELNISPVDFGNNAEYLFLDDPEIWIKVLNDENWTEFKPLGYAHLEKSFSIEKEYAEFKTGIPETLVDKALISVTRTFTCTIAQLQPETISLISEGIIESEGDTTYVHYGSAAPAALNLSIILKGRTRNGKPLELRLRRCIPTSESIELAFGAQEFAGMQFTAEVLRSDDPLGDNPDWQILGQVVDNATNTEESNDLTLSEENEDIEVGMMVYGDGIPEGSKVTAIDTVTITIDKEITDAYAEAREVKFIDEGKLASTDVGYWLMEK